VTLAGLTYAYDDRVTPFPPETLGEIRGILESRGGSCNVTEEGIK